MLHDLRHAFRLFSQSRSFALTAVVMLALGIGATTAIFSIVDAALLRPLPYRQPDELVVFSYVGPDGRTSTGASPRAFLDWREQQQAFESITAVGGGTLVLVGDGEPEQISVTKVTAEYFSIFGAQPMLGRVFGREAEDPVRGKVAVLGYGFWQRRYAGRPDIVGQSMKTDAGDYEILGVLQATFRTANGRPPEIILPLAFDENDRQPGVLQSGFLSVEGRLDDDMSREQAAAQMTALETALDHRRIAFNKGRRIILTPLHEHVTGASRSWMLLLLGSVAFVLLIACVNVASLFIAHGSDRARELSVRSALGASRWRLARLMFVESVTIAVVGSVAGALLAWWVIGVFRTTMPGTVPRAALVALDVRALAFTSICAIATGLLCGVLPAWKSSRIDLTEGLKEASRVATASRTRQRLGQLLAFAEVAGALVLLVGAGLFITSFVRLMATDPGFRTDNLLAMSVSFPNGTQRESVPALARDLLQRVKAIPGVDATAFSQNSRPFSLGHMSIPLSVHGKPGAERVNVIARTVSPEYLDTLGVRLLRGRPFSWRDSAATPAVGVINERAARQLFGGAEPIGQRLQFNKNMYEIVGVVADIRHLGLARAPEPELFIPLAQNPMQTGGTLVVRHISEAATVLPLIKSRILEISPNKPIRDIASLDETARRSAAPRRFNMFVLSIFGALALAIAALGVYGVMAQIVRQRTHEIAVRMALGARADQVQRMFVRQGAVVIGVGLAAGLVAAGYLARTAESFLFEVRAQDPRVFVAAAIVLAGAGLIACWIPARRAGRVDPLESLRSL